MLRFRLAAPAIAGLLLLSIACSDNPALRKRYELEKQFFQAEKKTQNARLKPDLLSTEMLSDIRVTFSNLVQQCYEALAAIEESRYPKEYREIEQITFNSTTRYVQFLYADQQFDSCVIALNRLLREVRLPKVEAMTAYYNLGRALQVQGKWDSALTVYDNATEKFYPPVDRKSNIVYQIFNLPLHLHEVMVRVGDDAGAVVRFVAAQNYYQRLISEFPGTMLQTSAHANLARLYENGEEYDKAVEQLQTLRDSTGTINAAARLRIADILAARLNKADSAQAIYGQLQQSLTGPDTALAPIILFKKALVYLQIGRYRTARRELNRLDRDFPRFYKSLPQAQLAKAESFEKEGNWERAETEYRFLIENFRASNEAMSVHLYLAGHYIDKGRKREAEIWEERAGNYFDQIAREFRGGEREAAALSYKAELYRMKKDWPGAARILTSVFDRFPDTEVGRRAMVTAAALYAQKLKERPRADSLLQVLRDHMNEVRKSQDNTGSLSK